MTLIWKDHTAVGTESNYGGGLLMTLIWKDHTARVSQIIGKDWCRGTKYEEIIKTPIGANKGKGSTLDFFRDERMAKSAVNFDICTKIGTNR